MVQIVYSHGYSTFYFTLSDIDECFEGNFDCSGLEECENLAGSYRCLCPKRLNLVSVNGTCQCEYVYTKFKLFTYITVLSLRYLLPTYPSCLTTGEHNILWKLNKELNKNKFASCLERLSDLK